MKKPKDFSADDQEKENLLLAERIHRNEPPEEVVAPDHFKLSRPELGHDPYSFALISGSESANKADHGFFGLRLKTAYHDLMAKDHGFTPFSEIDFPWVELRFKQRENGEKELRLHQLGALNITSLFPITALEKQLSWKLRILFDTEETPSCRDCFIPRGEGGGGFALGNQHHRFYLFAVLRQELHHKLNKGYRTRPGAEASWIWNPPDSFKNNYKMRLTALALTDLNPRPDHNHLYEFNWTHALSLKRNQELRLATMLGYTESLARPDPAQVKLEWLYYFR